MAILNSAPLRVYVYVTHCVCVRMSVEVHVCVIDTVVCIAGHLDSCLIASCVTSLLLMMLVMSLKLVQSRFGQK